MSLHFISGKPGGGKSLYSMQLLQDELLHGSRLICTNLPLNLGELNSYLQAEFPDRIINLHERVRVLDDATETGSFWLYRWASQNLASVSEENWKQGERYDFAKPLVDVGETDRGVLFIIDEIHLFFNSREWMNTGKGCLFYLSQHRKLGDDVIAVTQSIGNVDKQFRSLAQDFSYIRNMKKEKKGIFKLPGIFMRSTYSQPFTGQPGIEPMEIRTFRLQPTKLAACYNTAAGVGVLGRSGSDTRERSKGLPWWVAIVAVVAVCAGVAMVPSLIAKAVGSTVGKAATQPARAVATLPAPAVTNAPSGQPRASVAPEKAAGQSNPPPVSLIGHYTKNGRLIIMLSDGTRRQTGIEWLDENGAVIDGQRYRWATVPGIEPAQAGVSVVTPRLSAPPIASPDTGPERSDRRPLVRVTHADGKQWQNY